HHDHAGGLRPVLDAQDRRRGLRLVQRPGQRPVRLTVALAGPAPQAAAPATPWIATTAPPRAPPPKSPRRVRTGRPCGAPAGPALAGTAPQGAAPANSWIAITATPRAHSSKSPLRVRTGRSC